jgi:tetratricopeptide (TPR) repeat protein
MNESVQKWLDELTAAPSTAIQKLVLGYAGVSVWSRSSLRESFVEIFQTHTEALDAAVAAWLQERLMKLPPEKTPTLVWASHLQDLFSALAGLPLPQVARLLRDRLRDFRSWLRPLRTDESLDPEAAYLAALAWADTNQHLEGMWQGLALRRDRQPAYYTDIGLLGLRKTRDERGQLPSKAPFLLLATLIDLADTGLSQKDWLLTTRALLGGYHYSLETWVREFEPVLEARQNAQNGPKWLKKILPLPSDVSATPVESQRRPSPAFTLAECNWFVAEVKRLGPDPTDKRLESFLDSHRGYANVTNNPHYLVRTFNRLAEAAKDFDPEWAVARAEEALEWHRGDPRNWTVLARCLWARARSAKRRGDFERVKIGKREALDTLWAARFRIPYNTYIRAELGRFHREAGDLPTAEAIYREASAEFPSTSSLRCGLAEVLAASGHIAEAEAVYRQAILDFPDQPVPRDGLAALLQDSGRSGEAEQLYRQTYVLLPNDDRSRTSLADILFRRSAVNHDEKEREEAHKLYREAAALGSAFAEARLKLFDDRWLEFAEQPPLLSESNEPPTETRTAEDISAMGPTQRLGRALLCQWLATRDGQINERERLFAEAEALLTLPDELTGECRTAFVEARGFLLLARDRATEARAFFEQQLAAFPRPPLGLRLGFAEARARLGETLSDAEEAELASFGPEGSILPLVLKVVRLLESTASDDELRDLLLELYPRVRELAGMPASELGEEDEPVEPTAPARQPETPDTMMAQLLLASVFRPAAINTPADLQAADSIPRVRASLKAHRDDIFSVAEKLALAA